MLASTHGYVSQFLTPSQLLPVDLLPLTVTLQSHLSPKGVLSANEKDAPSTYHGLFQ